MKSIIISALLLLGLGQKCFGQPKDVECTNLMVTMADEAPGVEAQIREEIEKPDSERVLWKREKDGVVAAIVSTLVAGKRGLYAFNYDLEAKQFVIGTSGIEKFTSSFSAANLVDVRSSSKNGEERDVVRVLVGGRSAAGEENVFSLRVHFRNFVAIDSTRCLQLSGK